MIKVIPQFPIRKQLPRQNQVAQLAHRFLGILARRSVEIAPEYTGIAVGPEKDEGVGDGLEAW